MNHSERYLLFEINDEHHAVPLNEVAEVLETAILYPIPRAPEYFAGAMNLHGAVVPVLDFQLFCNKGRGVIGGQIVVLDRREASLALQVGKQVNILSTEKILEKRAGEGFIESVLVTEALEVPLISIEKLLETVETTMTNEMGRV